MEFFRLGGEGLSFALGIVKNSLITSTIIWISSERLETNTFNSVNYDNLLDVNQRKSMVHMLAGQSGG